MFILYVNDVCRNASYAISQRPELTMFQSTQFLVRLPDTSLTRLRQAHRPHPLRERHRPAQLQQRNVVIVRVDVEVAMSNDCRHRPHDCRRLRRLVLVVIPEKHAYPRPLQLAHAMSGRQHEVAVEEGATAVELTVVDETSDPRVTVEAGRTPADDSDLRVGDATICCETVGQL